MKSKTTPKITLKTLAAGLGLSTRRTSELKRLGMSCDSVESAKAWRDRQSGGNSVETLRARRIQVLEETRLKLKMENDVRAGKLIDSDEVQTSVMNTMAGARLALTKALLHDAPPRLEGLPANRIARELKGVLMDILNQLSHAPFYDSPEVKAIVAQAKAEVGKV